MQEYTDFISQNMIMVVVWAGLFVALIMNIFKSKTAGYTEITPAELTQFINKDEGVVLDIRSKDEFKSGHITGALHVLPSDIKNGSISSLEKYKSSPIIVVCKSGQTAAASANDLHKAGFEKVYLLKNGLIAWSEANMPLIRGKK